METTERRAINDSLKKYCIFAGDDDYVEITEWSNSNGIDVDINGEKKISLTYGELEGIIYLVKTLEFNDC